jgi:hypothetical protein
MAQMAAHPFVPHSIFTVVANSYLHIVVRFAGVYAFGAELTRCPNFGKYFRRDKCAKIPLPWNAREIF